MCCSWDSFISHILRILLENFPTWDTASFTRHSTHYSNKSRSNWRQLQQSPKIPVAVNYSRTCNDFLRLPDVIVTSHLRLNDYPLNTAYRKKSFPSKESGTNDLTEYIFRLRNRHHQLLFKQNLLAKSMNIPRLNAVCLSAWASEGFFQGEGALGDFSKIFPGWGQKWWNLFFRTRNQESNLFCWIFQNPGGDLGPPCRLGLGFSFRPKKHPL